VRGSDRLGYVTSAAVAPTLGGSAGLAWIDREADGEGWGVEVRGEVEPASVQAEPFFDPLGERLRR
jgi:dimethylglycine dehydrogenase